VLLLLLLLLPPAHRPGWDFISRSEVTIGEAMSAGGYRTTHFGKWHNLQVLGYEPWHIGFQVRACSKYMKFMLLQRQQSNLQVLGYEPWHNGFQVSLCCMMAAAAAG
jgi:hypothetical protein